MWDGNGALQPACESPCVHARPSLANVKTKGEIGHHAIPAYPHTRNGTGLSAPRGGHRILPLAAALVHTSTYKPNNNKCATLATAAVIVHGHDLSFTAAAAAPVTPTTGQAENLHSKLGGNMCSGYANPP